ncbi:MAG: hypothetical protein WCV63_01315 [Negativicutes bacterium]
MKKRFWLLFITVLIVISTTTVFAGDPLTDYRLGHFAVNLNYIYGSERSGFTVQDTNGNQLTDFATTSGGTMEYVATAGIGHNFAIQYRNWGVNSTLKPPSWYTGTVNNNLTNQEVSLLYRVGPRLWNDLADDISSVFSGKPSAHEEKPATRDLFALVVGWDNISASQSGNIVGTGSSPMQMLTPANSNRNSVVVGYEMCYQVFPRFYNSIRATYSFNNAFYGEFGYSYNIYDDIIFGGQIATKDIFNNSNGPQADNFYMTGLMLGLTYQY